jgi:Fe2+ or Zn2+ uptake regulation protein
MERSVHDRAELPEGFDLESIQVTLAGRCARCAAASS